MENKQKKILVVDDEPDILEFLQVILEEEGYTVATTTKGEYVEKLHDGGQQREWQELMISWPNHLK